MSALERLHAMGLSLPELEPVKYSYVRARQSGSTVYLAGQTPKSKGGYAYTGKLGAEVSLEDGQECARLCMLNLLAAAQDYLGDLDRITAVLKVNGFVASAPTFTDQPKVINAASDLLVAVLGEAGKHARTAIGVPVLPSNAPVEIDMILEVAG